MNGRYIVRYFYFEPADKFLKVFIDVETQAVFFDPQNVADILGESLEDVIDLVKEDIIPIQKSEIVDD